MEINTVIVRAADKKHIDDLIRLRACLLEQASSAGYACRTEKERTLWRGQYRPWLEKRLEQNNETCFLIAQTDGQVIGCATGIIDQRAPARDCLSGRCGWIQSVVVEPDYRGNGVATRLINGLMEWFANSDVSKVVLESTPDAERFYITLGFVPDKEVLFTQEIQC
ncbi:GNAT family N-acetyltransferase [Salmonella enterica]|nr:GNAT family N-acetyltransferase [Salmonella enterica]